jgi:hypothetical protein
MKQTIVHLYKKMQVHILVTSIHSRLETSSSVESAVEAVSHRFSLRLVGAGDRGWQYAHAP